MIDYIETQPQNSCLSATSGVGVCKRENLRCRKQPFRTKILLHLTRGYAVRKKVFFKVWESHIKHILFSSQDDRLTFSLMAEIAFNFDTLSGATMQDQSNLAKCICAKKRKINPFQHFFFLSKTWPHA